MTVILVFSTPKTYTMETNEAEIYEYEREEGIPEFFEPGYVSRIIDLLPYYVPHYLKERLRSTHPDIPITTKPFEETYKPPRFSDYKNIIRGSDHLNELLTESLALSTYSQISDYIPMTSTYIEDLIYPFLDKYGRNNTTVELIQQMQVAMLSGDYRMLNEFMRVNYKQKSILPILAHIGQNVKDKKYHSYLNNTDNRTIGAFSISQKSIYIATERDLANSHTELISTTEELIQIYKIYEMFDKLDLLETKKDLQEVREIKTQYLQSLNEINSRIISTGIHEVIHYLSFDSTTGRCGFEIEIFGGEEINKLRETY